jgi:hypothetical protein
MSTLAAVLETGVVRSFYSWPEPHSYIVNAGRRSLTGDRFLVGPSVTIGLASAFMLLRNDGGVLPSSFHFLR